MRDVSVGDAGKNLKYGLEEMRLGAGVLAEEVRGAKAQWDADQQCPDNRLP